MKLQLLSRFTIVVFLFCTFNLFSQSLILNEVSQGPSGSKEYIELLVIPGTSPYNCTNYCLDLRNWVLDDNNGYFSGGATSGVGIANGAVRFKNDPFWQCIPIGTLIVIYNDLDPNASLPANDISTTDGNCKLVIPVNSNLLEHQTTSPTTLSSTYPSTGWISGGLWGPISMANGGDSFQVYDPSNLATPIHGVSWANNTINSIIYFAPSATNSVFYFGNTLDNNPSNQANWVSGTCSAPDNQTPGLPNNPANATYISSLNNNCAGPLVVTLIGSTDASSCLCNGQASVNASGSIPGYTYAWYNSSFVSIGQNTVSATNLCAGTYYCIVSSSINCTDTLLVTINNTVTSITPSFNPIVPICAGGTINLPTTSTNGITGSWSPAVNNTQTTTYTFTPTGGQCATTTTLQVSVGAPQTPTFATVGPYCAGASFSLPTSSIEGFTGSWSPAINATTTTSYSFTPTSGQCATTANLSVTINPIPTVSILENPTICAGQSTVLTTSTSIPGGTFAWNPGGQLTPTITVNPASSANYTVIYTVSGCASLPANSSVTVNAITSPTFNPIAPICAGGTINLPTTSTNGITGSWSPAVNNTQTTTYTFTPTGGQCATTTTLQVSVGAPQTPTFATVGPYCAGASFSLPTSSIEGFTGSWSPAINATTTTSYLFTPTSGQCATTANLSVTINPIPTVSILENPTICAGQSTVLTTSTSIPGGTFAWNPEGQLTPTITVNPTTSANYTLIYTVSGCASLPANSSVTVNAISTPTFNPIAPICAGGTINLPTTSTNGITGSWSPAVDNTQTTTYTFTPTGGQCANTTTLQVSVGAPQTPTFANVGPYCAGASFSLPTSSIEGFTGSWSPAINATTTTSYSFTPTSGQCATTANLSVTINPIPTVSILENPTICAGQSTVLTTSTSIPGGTFAWNPGGQLTPTITVNPASSANYTVIYTVSGCASLPASSSVTVNNSIIPQFASWGPFCQDALLAQVILPETSINGITGSWNPQMVSTATAGISTYTFTPTAGQCASDFQLLVEVFATPIIFGGNDITICAGNSITLSATGGAQYTWSNSVQNGIPFQAISSSVYTVSAIDANGCEGFDTVNITVLESPIAAFAPDVTTGIAPLTVQFINTSTNTTSYLWDFGNGNTLAVSNTNTVETTYLSAQTYEVWLVASNGFCADSTLATIIVLPAGAPEIVIPNVFTPNGDVTNDEWIIQTTNIASIEIVILNRWGNVMTEITDLATGWDGKTTNGDDATDGTYFYKYTAKALNGENLSGHGFLTLIR
ncbi:MAG: gliding motility-associated C-terminal domain-containing protein [Crocinitomicaceae bacterium]|nr:gliding motility-associated C-terminal domain-containing protein [Crocinitomicaceae bacterium]